MAERDVHRRRAPRATIASAAQLVLGRRRARRRWSPRPPRPCRASGLEEPARARRRRAGRSRGRRTRAAADDRPRRPRRPRRRSSGQSSSGGTAVVDGAPMRTTADPLQPAALEHRVGRVGRAEHHVGDPAAGRRRAAVSTASTAAGMPPLTSGGGRPLGLGDQPVGARRARRRRCCVPPTSMPSRRSVAGIARQLLHGDVVEVVAERPRPGQREPGRRAPHRVAGERHDRDPLAVPEPLGVDRVRRSRASSTVMRSGTIARTRAVLEGDQVLVLDLQPQQPAAVPPSALDGRRCRGRSRRPRGARRPITLPWSSSTAPIASTSAAHRVVGEPPAPARSAGRARPSRGRWPRGALRGRHRVFRGRRGAAELDGRGPSAGAPASAPSAVRMTTRLPRSSVITHGRRLRRRRSSIVCCCTSGKARPMRVGVDERQPDPRRPADRQDAVAAADLGRHHGDRPAGP